MGYAGKLVASGHCARVSLCPSVRTYLTSGGAFASAGILALGLVAAPPDVHGERIEVRAVQLAATTVPLAASPAGLLEEFISNQAQTVAPVALAVPGGAADINTAVVTAPLIFESVTDPATDRQQVNSAALSATTTAFDLPGILGPLYPYVGAALLIGGFAFVFLAVLPVVWFVETVASVLGLPPVLPLTATAEANPPTAPTLTSDPPLGDSASVTTATRGPADASRATETGKADVSPQVTSIDKRTHIEQVTTQPATETAEADEESTGPTAVNAPKPSASASTSQPVNPAGRPATPGSVVRDSLGVGDQLRDPSHPGNGGHLTTRTVAAGEGAAATAGSSSVASSSKKGGRSSGGDSSDGDAGGSE
jgi:hypothetical protein